MYNISTSEQKLSSSLGPDLSKIPKQADFKFAVIGDSHTFSTSIRSILSTAKERGCLFAIHTGDFVDLDDEIHYTYFLHTIKLAVKDFPLFLVRGNHETMSPDGGFSDVYLHYVPHPTYQFTYADSLFIILDSSSGMLGTQQLQQFTFSAKTFKTHQPESPLFTFLHIPPKYEKFFEDGLPESESMILINMLQSHEIDYLFSGHHHVYHEINMDTSFLIINGCGGGSFYAPSPEVLYVEVTVNDKKITHEKIFAEHDILFVAKLRFFFYVVVMQHRAVLSAVIIFILLYEVVFWLKVSRKGRGKTTQV